MNFILFSDAHERSISQSIGRPEDNYDIVLEAYRLVLESLGQVHMVQSIAEVDPLYQQLQTEGQESLFLSFLPAQQTPTDMSCPTICVVAWEFDSIPDECWDNDPQQDWSRTLARHGRVITLSSHTARAVRKTLGEDFPVLVLPVPVWEKFDTVRSLHTSVPINPGTTLDIKGCILDTRVLGLFADMLLPPLLTPEEQARLDALRPPPLTWHRRFVIAKHYLRLWGLEAVRGQAQPGPASGTLYLSNWYWEGLRDLLSDKQHSLLAKYLPGIAGPQPLPEPEQPAIDLPDTSECVETQVDGVVYVSLFDPGNNHNNWPQLISAFCWAFRETADATLVLRITQNDLSTYYNLLLAVLTQLSPFACRVVVMHGDLDERQHTRLYKAASFYVNASRCEGLCLPVMEFMACGKPVIAPAHTAMEDYIDQTVAFVVKSSEEPTFWPQDTRSIYRTRRHRPDWGSLKMAYQDSYRMAKEQPDAYLSMSGAAIARMHDYCAFTCAQKRLSEFFGLPLTGELGTVTAATVADNALC